MMARYIAKPSGWISPVEEQGTLQNIGDGVIEVSVESIPNTGIRLGTSQMITFSGTVYIRSIGNSECSFTTVPFSAQGKGGGSGEVQPYVLPTASESIKGGVRVGSGLAMNEDVLNLDNTYIPMSTMFKNGVLNYTQSDTDGSYNSFFTEVDSGGGNQYYNAKTKTMSYIGVNKPLQAGSDVDVQVYSKDATTNIGTRLNISSTKGIFYLKNGLNQGFPEGREILVKDDLNGFTPKSAYDVAVDNGFVGTEEEWLESLQGEQGEQGAKGNDGESVSIFVDDTIAGKHTLTFTVGQESKSTVVLDGKDGIDGKDGENGKDGANGIDGKDGTDGKDGINGKDGKDGDTEEWVANKSYEVGRMAIYGNNIYKCITANSDSVFNTSKWQLIGSYPVYSTQEFVVGTWTDNKTLYQKTYISTTPQQMNTFVKLTDLDQNIDTIVDIGVTCEYTITGTSDINSITDSDPVKVVAFDGALYCKIYSSYQAEVPIYVTIKFTKST